MGNKKHRQAVTGWDAQAHMVTRDALGQAGDAFRWDPADEIDREEEVFADRFGVGVAQAREILAWAEGLADGRANARVAEVLMHMVGLLLTTKASALVACVAGLAFASGLACFCNGFGSQSDFARARNITRASVSHWVTRWADVLRLVNYGHRKSEEARERYARDKSESHWRR